MNGLRSLRTHRNLTLESVAEAVGTDTGNLSRVERGQQGMTLELARRLAGFYNVSVDKIVGGPIRTPLFEPTDPPPTRS